MQLLVDCGQESTALQGQGVCRGTADAGRRRDAETASRTAQVWEDCVGSTQRVRAQSWGLMLMGSTALKDPLWEDGTGRLPRLL